MSRDDGMDVSPSWQELKGERDAMERRARAYETGATKLQRERDQLREALSEIAMRIEGDLCQTARDVINGLGNANDIYDDAENIERIARTALKAKEES